MFWLTGVHLVVAYRHRLSAVDGMVGNTPNAKAANRNAPISACASATVGQTSGVHNHLRQ